jgi:hypothetical protein
MRSAPLWVGCLVLLAACGNGSKSPNLSPGKVTLAITALHPRGGDVWSPPCNGEIGAAGAFACPDDPTPIPIDADRQLGVDVSVENFYLRAPDTCGSTVQCGIALLELDPNADGSAAASVRGASTSLLLDLSPLPALCGAHVLRPSLLGPSGSAFTGPWAEQPSDLSLTFTADDCSANSGGAGGEGPLATAGGSGAAGSPP